MYKGKTISPAEVDFWLDSDKYSNFFEQVTASNKTLVFNVDMVRLASIRKAISNFVRILTRRNIPVYFNDASANINFDGKVIYISAEINNKQDFDVAVGQALHEGAHTLKTNFNIVKIAYANIPKKILTLSDEKYIRRATLEKFIHTMWNVIEDRYIDNYVFNEAPGYRGYYVALYERFWNCSEIDQILLDPDLYRIPSIASYSFRITNFTNPNTDLLALPMLENIARTIDITNIDRLVTTKDRINKAFEVVEIVLDCLDKDTTTQMIMVGSNDELADPSDFFDFGECDGNGSGGGEESGDKSGNASGGNKSKSSNSQNNSDDEKEEVDVGKDSIHEISDVLTGKSSSPDKPKENEDIVNKISNQPLNKQETKRLDNLAESQRQFLLGEIPKGALTPQQKSLLDLVEKHGIILVQVNVPNVASGDEKNLKVDCVVVQKMTKELVFSGEDIFPLAGVMKMGTSIPEAPKEVADAVKKGISLGTKLGRKLQIRNESNPIKTIRKKWGKINKRQLHEAGFDADDLFYKVKIDNHKRATLHITVDASSSMIGEKWYKTMTAVVAICKAASMIDNIHITVSFRTTQVTNSTALPYIVLAYDSKKDKFSKIRNTFPYLVPNGCTPEGLAFEATMNLFDGITPDEEDRYFLNLSDGEPCYHLSIPHSGLSISYTDDVGATHTKSQVDKIRKYGVNILSYFIEEDEDYHKPSKNMTPQEIEAEKKRQSELDKNPLRRNFRKMYGKSAKFIDVENIMDLTKTINELFLSKENKSS
jgi:hypothetical protein